MESYLRHIYLRMDTIKHNPKIGRERPDLAAGLRCLPEKSHLIFYLVDDAQISIVAVLHQSMDVTRKLG